MGLADVDLRVRTPPNSLAIPLRGREPSAPDIPAQIEADDREKGREWRAAPPLLKYC